MNKRGIVFTTIAVILLSILILMFLIQSSKKTELEITKSTVETDTLNSFVKSLKTQHIPNAIKVSSNQAIYALLDYMEKEQEYLSNSETDIINTVMTGNNPEGDKLNLMFPIYEGEELNYTINSTLDEIKQLASQTNINFTFSPININITQKDSWTLKVTIINFNFTVSSSDGKVKWIDIVNISTELPITNYRDPVILLNESNNFTIQQADITNYPNPLDDIAKIVNQVLNHTFNAHATAPSFLQRMQGSLSQNPNGYGIEYIVNPIFNDNPNHVSLVDHIYWKTNTPSGTMCFIPSSIAGLPNFYIDGAHLIMYGIPETELGPFNCQESGGT